MSNLLKTIIRLGQSHASDLSKSAIPDQQIVPKNETNNLQASKNISNDKEPLGFASKVWSWLAARNDVFIGQDAEFNDASLSELLQLPEDESVAALDPEVADGPTTPPQTPDEPYANVKSAFQAGVLRPRVFLSDEQHWRLITGHGPDLKRVPKFEWLALVDIAATRHEGVLQGDLVRITGQDKRSLPTRTDALAAKGYIIKQSILVRGCRSSKLWLTRFAESAAEDAKREGLPLEELDLSRDALASNLDPVPFCDLWNTRPVDYLAIAQSFIAVSKAWDMIRYCDLRTKLGVETNAPVMRALAKTSRLFTDLGVIRFMGGRFAHNTRVYKDCVKFVREPTEQEWKEFRAVPRNRIQAPSQRLGKRGEAYRASLTAEKPTKTKQKKQPKAQDDVADPVPSKRSTRLQYIDYEAMTKLELGPLSRSLQKPFHNTVYDIIQRAGDAGSSNTELAQLTLGHAYKKMIAAVSRSISAPPRGVSSEPYRIISHKHRVGKIDAYRFFSTGIHNDETVQPDLDAESVAPADRCHVRAACTTAQTTSVPALAYDFTDQPAPSTRKRGLQTLSQLARMSDGRPRLSQSKTKKRTAFLEEAKPSSQRANAEPITVMPSPDLAQLTQDKGEVPADLPEAETTASPKRRGRGRASRSAPSLPTPEPVGADVPLLDKDDDDKSQPQTPGPPIVSAVFRGPDNSLDPPGKKGRRKRSYVVVVRNPKVREALLRGFNSVNSATTEAKTQEQDAENGAPTPHLSVPAASATLSDHPSTAIALDAPSIMEVAEESATEAKIKPWKCEKCGKRWKNNNGLDYHQKVAKVPCNPAYVPVVKEAKISRPRPPSPEPLPSPIVARQESKVVKRPVAEPLARIKQPVFSFGSRPRPLQHKLGNGVTSGVSKSTAPKQSRMSKMIMLDTYLHDATAVKSAFESRISQVSQVSRPLTAHIETPSQPSDIMQIDNYQALHRETPRKPIRSSQSYQMSKQHDPGVSPGYPHGHVARLWAEQTQLQESVGSSANAKMKPAQLRNDRVRAIIDFVFSTNDGVFPGDQSLLLVVNVLWGLRYSDMPSPDDRALRRMINKLERDGFLAQSFFSFFDDHSQAHNISVLVDAAFIGSLADASGDPRVLMVKEGIKKHFPNPYLPEGFEFANHNIPDTRMDDGSSEYEPAPGSLNGDSLEEVEILPYALPVMTEITPSAGDARNKVKKRSLLLEKKPASAKRAKLTASVDLVAESLVDGQPIVPADTQPSGSQEVRVALVQATPDRQGSDHVDMSFIDPQLEEAFATSIPAPAVTELGVETPRPKKKPGPKPGSKRKPRGKPQEVKKTVQELESAEQDAASTQKPPRGKGLQRGGRRAKHASQSITRNIDFLAASRSEQDAAREWIESQHIPDRVKLALERSNQCIALADLDDNDLGDFERSVDLVQHWELKNDAALPLFEDGITNVFVNHGLQTLPQHFATGDIRWAGENQLDENMQPLKITIWDTPLSSRLSPNLTAEPAVKRRRKTSLAKDASTKSPKAVRKTAQAKTKVLPQRARKPTDYNIRALARLPAAHQGRIHKRRPSTDRMGLRGETDIISAFVIFKILGGGVDRTSDYGMVLKLFPDQSLSGLKRLWGRVIKERKVHIAALSKIFPHAFLKAYKKGEVAPLDYDHFEDYDWLALVKWASRLRLYDDVDLPSYREDFDDEYDLEDPVDQVPDWREMWFSITSLFSRIDVNSGKAASTLATGPQILDDELILRARSWIRSLTRTQITGPGTAESIREKLLELCQGDEDSTNQLLEVVVTQLTDEKFATRTKGKRVSQSIRLNANFTKHFERNAHVDKFAQAIAFKDKMDAIFREGKEFKLSYGADDGSSMAILNLQAYRRVNVRHTGFRHIPMGHEPGNYEGRKFPKNYYHFTIHVTPAENYLYNDDIAMVSRAVQAEIPTQGPNGEIPAWANLFGKADYTRWIEYLCTFAFAAATRGPVTAQSMCLIFKPTFELFEAQLLIDFVDRLGLLKRITPTCEGVTVDEWWWLVIGSMLDEQQKAHGLTAVSAAVAAAEAGRV